MKTGNETAPVSTVKSDQTMQDITETLEARLYGEPESGEPTDTDDDEVLEGELALPESDDSESDDEEGLDDDLEDDGEGGSLSEFLGIDDDRIIVNEEGETFFKAIIDGETKEVPIKDLVSSFQLQSHTNNKSISLEKERKEFEDTRKQASGELHKRLEGVTALAGVLESELVGEYNDIDWDRLRSENPAEWSALKQDYSERAKKITQIKDLSQQENKRLAQEHSENFSKEQTAFLQEQQKQMLAENPEWSDPAKLKVAKTEMTNFMSTKYGFEEGDLDSVMDYRVIKVLRDAKAYHEGKAVAETKKDKRVPNFRKPGASKQQAAALSKARNVKSKRAAIAKSNGHVSDVANLLVDRM
jgi:hypothetical protein